MAIYNYQFQTANGNITANTSSYIVTGNLTDFTKFTSGTVLLTANGNIAIGKVMHVTSNVSLILASNANVNVTESTFSANVFSLSSPVQDFGYNPGTITVSNTSGVVYGNSTYFSNSVSVGDKILAANADSLSFQLLVVGVVDHIYSDTRLYLKDNSTVTGSGLQFSHGNDFGTQYNWRSQTVQLEGSEPDGFFNMITPMFSAIDAGIFNNAEQVQSYHPPVPDPVTGIMVNIPASTYQRHQGIIGNVSADVTITGLTIGQENQLGMVKEFDAKIDKFGTSATYVRDSVPNIDQIALASSLPPEVYTQVIKDLYYETTADRYAAKLGRTIPRITDNHADATAYIEQQHLQLTDAEKQNLAASADNSHRYVPAHLKQLKASGVPVSIPGLINAVNDIKVPNPNAWVQPSYTVPMFPKND